MERADERAAIPQGVIRLAERSTTNGSGYEEVPIGDLIRGIAEDASTLVRKELDLAKQEVTEGIKGRSPGP